MSAIVNTISNFNEGMVILKAYIYRKHWGYEVPKTGEVIEGDRYLTLFTMIPATEFRPSIEMHNGQPTTMGVFTWVIGSTEGLIITPYRVILSNYQNHLELNGWTFVQTVPGAKGGDFEDIRRHAYSIIKNLDKARKEVEKTYVRREGVNQLIRLIREEVGSKSTILPYLKQIENVINT